MKKKLHECRHEELRIMVEVAASCAKELADRLFYYHGGGSATEEGHNKDHEAFDKFNKIIAPILGEDTYCTLCDNTREILHFYDRPGGLPGNQIIPCPRCSKGEQSIIPINSVVKWEKKD